VQPKKETVRINLPPKPSAAPTIKLPTLPPSGATGASGLAPAPAPAHAAAAPASQRSGTAAPVAQRPGATPQRSAAVPVAVAAPTLSPWDAGLAIAAAVVGLLAVGTTVYLAFMLGS
jgi:hypothetical protein